MIKIFNHYFHRRTVLQVMFDMGLVVVALILALYIQSNASLFHLAIVGEGFTRGVLIALGVLSVNSALGFYERGRSKSSGQMRARAVLSVLLSGAIASGVLVLLPLEPSYDAKWVVLVVLGTTGFMLTHRVLVGEMLPTALKRRRVLVYGTGERAATVGQSLQHASAHVELVGYYASPNETEARVPAAAIVAPGERLDLLAQREGVDEIVVALTDRRGGAMPMRELLDCKLRGVRVSDVATYFEQNLGQIRIESASAGWLIFGEGFNQGFLRTLVKRVFDIVSALILLVLTLPLMLVTALLVKLESPGPVFYSQERVGLNGRIFKVVKFRSMRNDAEKDGVPRWATAGDSRVTRIGRILRKVRIDELPQLFCVLKGDMSMVGPRPERPYFVDQLVQDIPFYAVRHSVKPGVTGWAQVSYHYGASKEDTVEKLQYDLYYVKNHSLFLDVVVLFETIGVVLTGSGAH
ncbi:TIGR03013 family XrtA/PEP-CTERM system glycosyltransferase [Hydrogenophaga intermedia]|uniref:TIGR03013 family XrtA/PEP-CTERM system glycosyltransferase n=1 Tax=Hydrogenophaga intermedia TaxID=65786 RepID=UPI002043F68F|nr:TIGR03013 family PEP-CTERM/XrtA system glycosyltransferase [Hydrogenophaga intermedia]